MREEFEIDELIENIHIFAEAETIENGVEVFTRRELIDICLTAIEVLGNWECFTCGVDAFALGEDFYVQDELWRTYGVEGMLCIGCFEKRLGRELTRGDFKGGGGPDEIEKHFPRVRASERYRDRWSRE